MRGYELRDPLGRKIGRLEELFAGEDVRAKHVRVRVGPFGLEERPDSDWSGSGGHDGTMRYTAEYILSAFARRRSGVRIPSAPLCKWGALQENREKQEKAQRYFGAFVQQPSAAVERILTLTCVGRM
jgi:hypothetical protein